MLKGRIQFEVAKLTYISTSMSRAREGERERQTPTLGYSVILLSTVRS